MRGGGTHGEFCICVSLWLTVSVHQVWNASRSPNICRTIFWIFLVCCGEKQKKKILCSRTRSASTASPEIELEACVRRKPNAKESTFDKNKIIWCGKCDFVLFNFSFVKSASNKTCFRSGDGERVSVIYCVWKRGIYPPPCNNWANP